MSFIDYINITFEEIVNNICENNEFIIDITHLESNVITLFKETKYNLNFNEKIDNIFNKYDTLNWVADITYAKSKYKFNPKYNLVTGLTQIYETRFK